MARLAQSHGLRVSRRSAWPQDANAESANEGANESTNAAPPAADLWLGDSLGEMPAYYAAARVALLGASFAPLGGQNLIEAAACACPVVMGPHTFNFAQAAESAQAAGAALRAPDMPAALAAGSSAHSITPSTFIRDNTQFYWIYKRYSHDINQSRTH